MFFFVGLGKCLYFVNGMEGWGGSIFIFFVYLFCDLLFFGRVKIFGVLRSCSVEGRVFFMNYNYFWLWFSIFFFMGSYFFVGVVGSFENLGWGGGVGLDCRE